MEIIEVYFQALIVNKPQLFVGVRLCKWGFWREVRGVFWAWGFAFFLRFSLKFTVNVRDK